MIRSVLYCFVTPWARHYCGTTFASVCPRHSDDTAQKYTIWTVEIFFVYIYFVLPCFHLRTQTRSTGLFHLFEVNILLMWQHNFTSQLSFCLCSSRWVRVKAVCLHSQSTDGLCWELCPCIDEALFSDLDLLLGDELAMRWSLAVIYKRSISVVPNIAAGVLAMPNLSWQLLRGFEASGRIQVIYGLGFNFKLFICIWEQIMLSDIHTHCVLILLKNAYFLQRLKGLNLLYNTNNP